MGKKLFSIWFILVLAFTVLGSSSVFAKETVWKMTSTWSSGITLIDSHKMFADLVNVLCKGKLRIEFFPGGTLMPAFEVFDACRNNTVQAAGDWCGYWAGKDIVFSLLGACPMGLTQWDQLIWVKHFGGDKLFDEAFGKFDMVYLITTFSPSESGLRSNKPIKSLADLKGKKIRMSGKSQGYVLKELGASQVLLAGSEVYQALQKGTIDAAEFSGPYIDFKMGLGEVTKYWLAPGWHQPGSVGGVMINKKAWDALDSDTQEKLKIAAEAVTLKYSAQMCYEDLEGTRELLKKGVQIYKYSEAELDKIEKIANKYLEQVAKEDPLCKKVIESWVEYRKSYAQVRNTKGRFGFGFNPKEYPDLGD
ncbi:MAG: TRAP transporter substrate-binding protein DctP [Deltaproteobacteria bacterium]|nr:TRAP transporter substrate-binding protein DctP [Deltaproteobacteria bacterium]